MAGRFPGLKIVANHLSLGGERSPQLLAEHIDKLASLVPHQNVAVTISSLPMSSDQDYPYTDIHDSIRGSSNCSGRRGWPGPRTTPLPGATSETR